MDEYSKKKTKDLSKVSNLGDLKEELSFLSSPFKSSPRVLTQDNTHKKSRYQESYARREKGLEREDPRNELQNNEKQLFFKGESEIILPKSRTGTQSYVQLHDKKVVPKSDTNIAYEQYLNRTSETSNFGMYLNPGSKKYYREFEGDDTSVTSANMNYGLD